MEQKDGIRLNKYISSSGFCSRREADDYIENNRVTVNGKPCNLGTIVLPSDKVKVDSKVITSIQERHKNVYIALNKPKGIISTTERSVQGNIVDYVSYKERIFPIGRLDKDSEGLILLTNDGDIVNKILRAGNKHEKEYEVTLNKPISEDFINKMSKGVKIFNNVSKKYVKTKPCSIHKTGFNSFNIILTEGLNRQIRRMCEALDYDVIKLKRIRIMNISLVGLPYGKWRMLKDQELNQLLEAIKDSKKN